MPSWAKSCRQKPAAAFLCCPRVSPVHLEKYIMQLTKPIMGIENVMVKVPPQWLAIVKKTLDERFRESLQMGELAAIARLHPVHLSRTFKAYYGCSIREYLQRLRLNHARQLLDDDQLSLTEIAAEAGFCDQGHFSKIFKKVYGTSPGSYRKSRDNR